MCSKVTTNLFITQEILTPEKRFLGLLDLRQVHLLVQVKLRQTRNILV